MMRWTRAFVIGLTALMLARSGAALPPIDADVVYVRNNCGGLTDCFTTLAAAGAWLWGTRHPTATDAVLVDIGPGEFDPFDCPSANPRNGHVTLRGSGRDSTRIKRAVFSAGSGAVTLKDCDNVTFQDLTVVGAGTAVSWAGAGSTQWFNVGVEGISAYGLFAYAWYDEGSTAPTPRPVHYWFSCKLVSTGAIYNNAALFARYTSHWFYGSELEANLGTVANGASIVSSAAAYLDLSADLRVFGSAVRSRTGSFCGSVTSTGVRAGGNSTFSMHGGLISASAVPSGGGSCATAMNATGILALGNARATTPGTAFTVSRNPTAGAAARLQVQDSALIDSPYLWPPGTTLPGDDLAARRRSVRRDRLQHRRQLQRCRQRDASHGLQHQLLAAVVRHHARGLSAALTGRREP